MNKDSKTLVVLSPGFPENEEDSTCLPAQQSFILSLKKNFPSLQIIVIALDYPFTTKSYQWYHVRVIPFNGWKKNRFGKLLIWARIWKSLKQTKKQHQVIGLVSFWCTQTALIGKYFAAVYGLTHYIWILGQDAKKENRWVKWIRPDSNSLIAISDFLSKEFLKNHSIRPGLIIPIGIDASLFAPGYFERTIDVLGVGSLIPLKQYHVFIDIIKKLAKQTPSVRSIICGKGPEEKNLQDKIVKNQLQNNIILSGERSHHEVLQLMQRSKVILHPSSYEGFSSVCLEALGAGAHVISFCKPVPIWIRHWHIVGDPEEMLQETLEILRDEQTEYSQVLPYTVDQNAKAIMKLFHYREPAIS